MTFSHTQKISAGVALTLAGLLILSGCSHEAPPNSIPSASDKAAHDPTLSNPAEGKPNHISPEMQAQIARYKSMSGGAAPTVSPGH